MQRRAPKLTVGIPTFNRAAWLRESVSSVLAQTFEDYRLIISDNASDDETPEVVREFADSRIEYVRSDRNTGPIANINRLISLATSEFLVLLPDDDLLYPEHLSAAVKVLDRLPSLGLVHTAFDQIDADGRIIRCVQPVSRRLAVTIQPRETALEWLMRSRWGPCFPSVMYRTAAIRDTGGFRPEDEPFGDRKLWMRLALDWDFAYLGEPLAAFRAHPGGITAGLAMGQEDAARARDQALFYAEINFNRRLEFIAEAGLEPAAADRLLAVATLEHLIERSHGGQPTPEIMRGLAALTRSHPQTLRRAAYWRLLLARSGGRTARKLLRRAARRAGGAGRRASTNRPTGGTGAKGPRIALFGHFGSLNAGNESTLAAALERLRARCPDAEFLCICTGPEAISARYGVDAVSIASTPAVASSDSGPRLQRILARVTTAAGGYARAFRTLSGTDTLIVPGTGLLTDAYGLGGWGPAGLFRWVVMARARRARVMFVSVGAGPVYSRRGRLLVMASLRLADYRSYRDEASRAYLSGLGFRSERDPVYPDLVFAPPRTLMPPAAPARGGDGRRVVGLGLMQYAGRYSVSAPVAETQQTYLRALSDLGVRLLAQGYELRLLIGDGDGDPEVLDGFESALRQRVGDHLDDRVKVSALRSAEDVIGAIAATDVVIATRFHNIVFALLLGKPVISISFHHKCSSLMKRMGMSEYCLEIDEINADRLAGRFVSLEAQREQIGALIGQRVRRERLALDAQYDHLLPLINPRSGRLRA